MTRLRKILWLVCGSLAAVLVGWAAWHYGLSDRYHLVRPSLLLLLLCLPWVWWMSRRSLAGLGRWRHRVVLSLRTAVIVLLVLAAAELQGLHESKDLVVYYLLDDSKSIPRDPASREKIFTYMKEAAAKKAEGDRVGLIVFGQDGSIEIAPERSRYEFRGPVASIINRDYTDIASAVQLATSSFPSDARKRIVLFTDGNENVGDVLDEVANAVSQGVSIDVYPIRYEASREIYVEKIVVPPEVKAGEPFHITVVVGSTVRTKVRLRLREGGHEIDLSDDPDDPGVVVELEPGRKNVFVIPRKLSQPTFYRYEATVEPLVGNEEDDTLYENNTGHGFTWAKGKARVLIVASSLLEIEPLQGAIQDEQIYTKFITEKDIPVNENEINAYDCIVLANIGKGAFEDADHMKRYESAVRDSGIGLVMIGGEDSFGAGGYVGTAIESALPVNMEVKMRKVMPNGALVLIMHTCEFPRGNWWAKKISKEAIKVLSNQDLVGLLYWGWGGRTGGDQWLFTLQPARRWKRMFDLIDTCNPGDMPGFGPSMQKAYLGLRKVSAALKHCIIITDGDPSPPSAALLNKFRAARISVSTIGIAPHGGGDIRVLREIAKKTGGRYYRTDDPAKLPQIFIKEAAVVRRSQIANEPFFPIVENITEPIKGFVEGEFPQLQAFVVTERKLRAEVALWATYKKEKSPLLAHWQYGLGRAVAFTSDATTGWAKHWVSWEKFNKFWTQTIRWATRKRPRSDIAVSTRISGGRGIVQVEAFDKHGEPINGLDLSGFVKAPRKKGMGLRLQQVAPGRYEGAFEATDVGTYVVNVSHKDKDGRLVAETSGASVSYSPEFMAFSANTRLLDQLIARTVKGKMLTGDPEKDDVFRHDLPPSQSATPMWEDLLWWAVALFFFDIFLRRVMFNWGKIAVWGAGAFATASPAIRRWIESHRDDDQTRKAVLAEQDALRGPAPGRAVQQAAFLDALQDAPASAEGAAAPGAAAPGAARRLKFQKAQPGKPAATTYTSRLLQAKKKALDDKGKDSG